MGTAVAQREQGPVLATAEHDLLAVERDRPHLAPATAAAWPAQYHAFGSGSRMARGSRASSAETRGAAEDIVCTG
ncbi:hypothetical protein GCM10025880_34580 [Methylorubrum aminovorans]|nr:hypothetical protein GCM10025880_34580 [Methylorubrum aminovorans]